MKKRIKERVCEIGIKDKVVNIIKEFQYFVGAYGDDCEIERDYYGYDGGYDLVLYKYREETDKEYSARLKKEDEAREKKRREKEAKEKKERELLEKLKQKYEA